MRRILGATAALAAALVLAVVPARAQDACTAKVMGECQAGGGDMGACMRAHMSELMACRSGGAAVSPDEAQAKGLRGVREVCGKEISEYCRHAKGDAALKACLQKHSAKLGPSCRESGVAQARHAERALHGSMASVESACREDGARLCPGLTFRTGEGPCLKKHKERVSAKCRDAVMGAQGMGRSTAHRYGG